MVYTKWLNDHSDKKQVFLHVKFWSLYSPGDSDERS